MCQQVSSKVLEKRSVLTESSLRTACILFRAKGEGGPAASPAKGEFNLHLLSQLSLGQGYEGRFLGIASGIGSDHPETLYLSLTPQPESLSCCEVRRQQKDQR